MTALLDPTQPHLYPRRALVCLVGLSPQVVTETLYALAVTESPPFLPTELHLIATARGAQAIREGLIGPKGPLQALQQDYFGANTMAFDPAQHLHIISREGQPIDDIQSVADNAAMSDLILDVIRRLSSDPQCAIHASIAGGRKSMSYYIGNVMSLIGRPQDRMSHVFVDEQFERIREFYFPPKNPVSLLDAHGHKVSTSQARIVLAPVPFVRLVDGLSKSIHNTNLSFSDLIAQAQLAVFPPFIRLKQASKEVHVSDTLIVKMPPGAFAWYCYFANRRHDDLQNVHNLAEPGMVYMTKKWSECRGFEQNDMDTICKRIGIKSIKLEIEPAELSAKLSEIRRILKNALGEQLANILQVRGPGEGGKRNGQYGLLGLRPDQIRLE